MIIQPLPLLGAFVISPEKNEDGRGFFARIFCEKEFKDAGLETKFIQMNNSLSFKKGTLRGMHYQLPDSAEVKMIRCIKGALYDVIVDIRPDSPTFKQWCGVELSESNRCMIYFPRGFAHGYITLEDNTEIIYFVSAAYSPEKERGIRYNDPAIGIQWPMPHCDISAKDKSWPDINYEFHGLDQLRISK